MLDERIAARERDPVCARVAPRGLLLVDTVVIVVPLLAGGTDHVVRHRRAAAGQLVALSNVQGAPAPRLQQSAVRHGLVVRVAELEQRLAAHNTEHLWPVPVYDQVRDPRPAALLAVRADVSWTSTS